MQKLLLCFSLFLLFTTKNLVAQQNEDYADFRGIYIGQTGQLIHDKLMQDTLITWLNREQFNAVAFYELLLLLGEEKEEAALFQFMRRLRYETNIQTFAAIGSKSDLFKEKVHPFQTKYGREGWFDFYLFENWWWQNSSFSQFSTDFKQMARNFGAIPAYLYLDELKGEEEQRQKEYKYVVENTSRVFIPFYGTKPDYHNHHPQLLALANEAMAQKKSLDIVLVFNMEDDQSGPLSATVSYNTMFQDVAKEFEEDKRHYPKEFQHIHLVGYQIYSQTEASKNRPLNPVVEEKGKKKTPN